MLSVTVTILRDMVESVMLLKDEAWGAGAGEAVMAAQTPAPHDRLLPTRSACRRRCFRRRRLCFRMRREEVLCSVELLSLGLQMSGHGGQEAQRSEVQRSGARGGLQGEVAHKQASHPLRIVEGRGPEVAGGVCQNQLLAAYIPLCTCDTCKPHNHGDHCFQVNMETHTNTR